MRYRLRTLLIVLALGPLVLAGAWLGWQKWWKWQNREEVFAPMTSKLGEVPVEPQTASPLP
jgi:hypothetical protein